MRRSVILFPCLAVLLALSLPATAQAEPPGQMHVKIVPDLGTYDLTGVSAWDPWGGTASWCSAGDCAQAAALVLRADGGTGTFRTGPKTAFVFTSAPDGIAITSVAGECTVTIDEYTTATLAGSVVCKQVPSGRGTVNLGARFRASSSSAPAGQIPGVAAPPQGDVAAAGGERIQSYGVVLTIRPDGVLDVVEEIEYNFGPYAVDRHGIYRDIPNRFYYDEERDRVMPIDVVSVTATGGASADYEVEDLGNGQIRIKVGDADRTVEGVHTYTIHYTVEGALNAFPDHDELYWNAIGTNWSVPIEDAPVEVRGPSKEGFTDTACYAGSAGSTTPCDLGPEEAADTVAFEQSNLGPYQGVTVTVAFPKGAVSPPPEPILVERWSFAKAFALNPATGSASGGLLALLLGAFGFLVWRNGRDRRYVGGQVAATLGTEGMPEETVPFGGLREMPVEFEPPDDIRPGQVGTLIDETANPLDVSATIVDLAVRGFLTIEEIPKQGLFGKPDWRLSKATPPPPHLLEYERRLYDGLFADADGDSVLLSELKTKFADRLKSVQEAMYRDAVRRKWFSTSPDKTRKRWHLIGWGILLLGVALTFVLARWTHVGLVGLALLTGGVVFAAGSHWMPRRTASGTAMVGRVKGFRRFIESPTQTGIARMSESENLFNDYLPYAIVFGCTDKWAKAFQDLGIEPSDSSWFIATRHLGYADLGEVFDSFATVASGTVAATPSSSGSSGFGGGGFSGGGGGGGGGGSW